MINQELAKILVDCKLSTKEFARTFLPRYFSRDFTPLHDQIFRVLDDDKLKKVLILAPRGIGKTTIVNLAFTLKRMLFRESRYIISLGASSDTAIEQTENLKTELMENERIRAVFGKMFVGRVSKEEFIVGEGETAVKVLPRGAGQKVRGRRYRNFRPDLIVVDDLENDKNVLSEKQRFDVKAWFFSSLTNLVDIYGGNWRIVVVGTILNEDSLLSNLAELPDWTVVRLAICDENLHSYIPTWLTDEQVYSMYEELKRAGEEDKFYMEFMNTVCSGVDGTFTKDMFRYYVEEEIERATSTETVILSDPARTKNGRSCETAILAVTMNYDNGGIYIRRVVTGRLSPAEHIDYVLDLADRYKASLIAPEITGLEEYLMYPLQSEQLRRYGRHKYEVFGVRPIHSKEDRAKSLLPMFRRGDIYFNKRDCLPLELALLSYPHCGKWDALDCLSNLLQVLDEGSRFMWDEDKVIDELESLAPLDRAWMRI